MKSPDFDMKAAISTLNVSEKKELIKEMKFWYSEHIRVATKRSTINAGFTTMNESIYFRALEYMAYCYFRLGMYEDALEYSENALLFYKDLVLALRIKAESLAFLDRTCQSRQFIVKHLRKHKLLEC